MSDDHIQDDYTDNKLVTFENTQFTVYKDASWHWGILTLSSMEFHIGPMNDDANSFATSMEAATVGLPRYEAWVRRGGDEYPDDIRMCDIPSP